MSSHGSVKEKGSSTPEKDATTQGQGVVGGLAYEPTEITPNGWSAWFGGKSTVIGPRIGPVLEGINIGESDTDESSTGILDKQIALEAGNAIQYRTCSWQKVRPFTAHSYSFSFQAVGLGG
jgi:hypothetical protein